MNPSQQYVKSVSSSHPRITAVRTNTPSQYRDRRHQYMAERRSLFDEARDHLASDFVRARVQGIGENFFDWVETDIRLSDVSTQSVTAFDSKQYDNFKEILFRSRAVDYIPAGAYVETMGSVWMVVNTGNMSSPTANAIIARCRAHWSFYDAYGNIRWEPLVIDRATMLSNRNEQPENLVMMEGYFNVKCQKNANTVKLRDNQRIILGSDAYHITGYTDFFEEFTGDDESAHVINFTIRREEPEEHDDLENHIADGLLFTWGTELTGAASISVGETSALSAHMTLNGVSVPSEGDSVQTWVFTSSDESVASVSAGGVVEGIAEGEAVITATLNENTALNASTTVKVEAASGYVRFMGVIPPRLAQWQSMTVTAGYFVGGENQNVPLGWTFGGAGEENYAASVSADGQSVLIECFSAAAEPLVITAAYAGTSETISIILEGY